MNGRRPRARSPREKEEQRSSRQLFLVILAAGVVGIVAILLWALGSQWNPELDEELCPANGEVSEEVLILLDATDPWNEVQKTVLRQQFQQIQEILPRFSRVHLYSIDPGQPDLRPPLLTLCNPGRVEDFEDFPLVGKAGARFVSNPAILEARWRDEFLSKLDSLFSHESERSVSSTSPIMETLRGAAIKVFGTGSPSGPSRSLYLFSDLLQNSDSFSLYGRQAWSPEIGAGLGDYASFGSSALEGVDVQLFLLDRAEIEGNGDHSRGALVELWDAFFSAQNATVVRVRRIEG